MTKLSAEDVYFIRWSSLSPWRLAKKYSVTQATISQVRTGVSRRNDPGPLRVTERRPAVVLAPGLPPKTPKAPKPAKVVRSKPERPSKPIVMKPAPEIKPAKPKTIKSVTLRRALIPYQGQEVPLNYHRFVE